MKCLTFQIIFDLRTNQFALHNLYAGIPQVTTTQLLAPRLYLKGGSEEPFHFPQIQSLNLLKQGRCFSSSCLNYHLDNSRTFASLFSSRGIDLS